MLGVCALQHSMSAFVNDACSALSSALLVSDRPTNDTQPRTFYDCLTLQCVDVILVQNTVVKIGH